MAVREAADSRAESQHSCGVVFFKDLYIKHIAKFVVATRFTR